MVRAAEKKDLNALRNLAVILLQMWIADMILRFDRGECAGEFAPFAEIYIHYVAPGGKAQHVKRMPLLLPGISYGTALWEPLKEHLMDRIRALGFDCGYECGPTGSPPLEELRRNAAPEIEALRARQALG